MHSILVASPEAMLRQAGSYWDFSMPQIDALASQKGENIAGVVFVAIAFILAFITIAFVPDGVHVFKSKGLALALAAVLASGLYATLYFVGEGIAQHQKRGILKLVVSKQLDEIIRHNRIVVSDRDLLASHAVNYLGLEVVPNESTRALLERMAREVKKDLPSSLDYSAVEPTP